MFTLVMEQADVIFPGYDKGDCIITTTQFCYSGDNYEEEIDHETGKATQYHYIRGSTGLTAVFIANDDSAKTDNLYYIHQDYLGSILCLSDEEGNPVERYSFDAWGFKEAAYARRYLANKQYYNAAYDYSKFDFFVLSTKPW
ncbi:MAG: hypothetical protein ACOCT9_03145 [archaeon]